MYGGREALLFKYGFLFRFLIFLLIVLISHSNTKELCWSLAFHAIKSPFRPTFVVADSDLWSAMTDLVHPFSPRPYRPSVPGPKGPCIAVLWYIFLSPLSPCHSIYSPEHPTRMPVGQWARTCITENRAHLHLYCLKAGWIGIRPSSMSTRLFFYSQDCRHSLFLLFFLYFLLRLRIRACTYVRMWGMTVYDISDFCFHFQLYLSWSYAFVVSYFCADVFLS